MVASSSADRYATVWFNTGAGWLWLLVCVHLLRLTVGLLSLWNERASGTAFEPVYAQPDESLTINCYGTCYATLLDIDGDGGRRRLRYRQHPCKTRSLRPVPR
jgi:hypothetical protein